uniref:Reverse transcriptase domain-containing protein n=1 Tax=Tanacetum cinerariifolium TaxID=118510 RepID=A0A6L2M8Q6_TANCI|nr:reverse transcriptase domain-containing protein [Tanacetum cinerariifolium]
MHQEKEQQEKLKAVKARLNFEEASRYSESETPSRRRILKERLGPRYARTRSRSPKLRCGRSKSPREKDPKRRTVFKRLEKDVFHRLGDKKKNVSAHSRGSERKSYYSSRRDTESYYQCSRSKETKIASEKHRHKREHSRRTEAVSKSEGGHWKSKQKKQKSSIEDDLSQPWVCEETNHFTPRICYFDFPKARMPSHIKTYDGSEDPEDHLKIFQAAAKTERWARPTWCHMFNSTLTENARVWFDDLPKESIDSYDDFRKTFLENYLQQKKYIKDPIEIHNIKQRDGESTEEFVRRGEVAASNRERKKFFPSWKQEAEQKQNFKMENFQNEQKTEQKQDIFTLLTKSPKEILALDKRKFKHPLPPPMTTPVEKKNASKLCEFHGEVGHTTNECMHLKRQIEEMLKAEKLSHLIKELKRNHGKDQAKEKKGGNLRERQITDNINSTTMAKDIKAKNYSNFLPRINNFFPNSRGRRWDGSKFRPEIKNQLIPANTPLVGFSGEIIWPIGKILLLVKIGDEEHSTFAWMNFMVVRSPSLYNGIIGRPGVRKIRAISSKAHGMIKFPVAGGIVTLQRSRIIPLECSMVSKPEVPRSVINQITKENIQVAIHPEYPVETIAIGSTLTEEGRKELCGLLRRYLDVFAWGEAPKRNKAINEEVKKLVEADIMKEVHYHSWLSNPVMVKKHDDSWRMCVDFKNLNKVCPKDGYPLPKIVWKVESLCGVHHKPGNILLLKNAVRTKKRWSNLPTSGDKAFQIQIGRNVEVYADDLVIKSRMEKEVIRDIKEMFKTLREINMKLNPKKCAFGMREGAVLGYKVDADGLRVCLDKVKAVLDLPSQKCLKDVQKLNEKLASLNRFLSKSTKKSLPFFKTLKKCTKKSDFQWIAEAERAFKEMKQLIAELPMLTAPREKEELIMYLAAAKEAISAFLMTERDRKFELGEHDIQYRPRTTVKGQILADFIVERLEDDTPDTSMEDMEELLDPWILFTDRSSCIDGSGAGLIITNPEGMEFTYALRFRFNATNNEAEYEALIASLRIAGQMGVQNLQENADSKLVANQVNRIYIAKESSMIKYLEKVKNLASTFKGFSIKQIPRGENKKAYALRKITSTSFVHLSKQVLVDELREKAMDEKEILTVV